ncbi:MAG: cadmium-translocating P-type ATPase [Lachnospiraceae bacterium]|nr:cadmium-translocating P-type ATPase [Lachnospiraceae bacterium]
MTKKLKKDLIRICVGMVVFAIALAVEERVWFPVSLACFIAAYLVTGIDVVTRAGKNLVSGHMLDENFLMTIATIGAFAVGEYPEAVAVMIFYQVGEFFQKYAVSKARKSIKDLMEICPETARVIREEEEAEVAPEEVRVGERLRIYPGEKIPLDGVILSGASSIDTKALTGESALRDVGCGDEVISGCINMTGVLEVEVKKEFGESTVSKILELVENAGSKKAETERFITRFARWYTPLVVIMAALLFVLPVVWQAWIVKTAVFEWALVKVYLYRAMTFLVISCPCALVISVPMSFFGGIGAASKNGILIKGSNYLENLVKVKTAVFDKTGTLTQGSFQVSKLHRLDTQYSEEQMLGVMAALENCSNHPIADAVCLAAKKRDCVERKASDIKELAGFGVGGEVEGQTYYVGNAALLKEKNIDAPETEKYGTVVYLATKEKCIGYCLLEDEPKAEAKDALESLKKAGIRELVMLTGDRRETAEKAAKTLGITSYHAGLLPGDKVEKTEEILQKKSGDEMVLFVGDGINDAPVLARADIGVAMGGLGSDAAIEAADIVIMDDSLLKLSLAIKIAKKTVAIVKQNIVMALGIKFLVLLFAAIGMAGMWLAIFADVGVAVLAILNALRALNAR